MFIYTFPTAIQVPHQVQVPYQATETQTQALDHKENYQIQTGHFAYSDFTLEAGKKLVVTWQTDNTVSVYVVTPSQFDMVKLLGSPTSSLERQTMTPSGSLSYQISSAGTYYVVISPFLNDVNVVSYKSELQWQEQVTKYRTETQYRTETIYTSSTFGINLGISLSVLGSILTVLSFVNLTSWVVKVKSIVFNRKDPENINCEYCGTDYKKTHDKCPNCGARTKSNQNR
jgi:hypothetical protein